MTHRASPRLPTPTLCLVTDLGLFGQDIPSLVEAVSRAVDGGVNMVQIRDPELSEAEFGVLVHKIATSVGGRTITVVNPSRRRISKIEGADGVQLAENAAMSVPDVRGMYGDSMLVGRSVHSVEGAHVAQAGGADFLVLGTIFPSASHPGGRWHGTDIISEVADETRLPVIGIGGIDIDNAAEVMKAGATGVAVVRSILGAADPRLAARELREVLDDSVGAAQC